MYEHPRHRRPARHRTAPPGSVYAAVVTIATLTLACCAEWLADTIINMF